MTEKEREGVGGGGGGGGGMEGTIICIDSLFSH